MTGVFILGLFVGATLSGLAARCVMRGMSAEHEGVREERDRWRESANAWRLLAERKTAARHLRAVERGPYRA